MMSSKIQRFKKDGGIVCTPCEVFFLNITIFSYCSKYKSNFTQNIDEKIDNEQEEGFNH